MASAKSPPTYSIEVRRTVPAPRERVYRAWTDPAALTRWFAPSNAFTTVVHLLEPKPGGRYRIEMRPPAGPSHTATGVFQEVEPPDRLAFTWRWEEQPAMPDTLVTVTLEPLGESTEVILSHSLFESERESDEHRQGWTSCLERLPQVL